MITITKILKVNRHKLNLCTCINLILFYILFLLLISFFSCKKEEERIMMVTNDSITDVAYTTAKAFATIVDPGKGIEQHGHIWSTDAEIISIITENKTENGPINTSGSYSSILTNLTPGESYYVRSYITDGANVIFGDEVLPFHTLSLGPPVVTTGTVTNIKTSGATVSGTLNSLGAGASSVTQHGHCWSSVTATPTTENGSSSSLGSRDSTGNYQSQLVSLSENTLYYVRAYATNNAETVYGDTISFTTLSISLPVVTTGTVTNITSSSATVSATLNSLGTGASSVTQYGHCWSSVTITPTIENDYTSSLGSKDTTGDYQSQLIGLSENTLYYVRAYATNSAGTDYGNEIEFTTLESGGTCTATLSDIDGNVYNTVQIGDQCWMKENLKTTKYRNGTDIPLITDNIEWANLTTAGYCWYDNDEASYKNIYGALYNWFTVSTGNLCPTGWHVPTDDEWKQLEMYLGMSQSDADASGVTRGTDEGGKLKEAGTTHWASPNTGATNETGFTALPGGQREDGYFSEIGTKGRWWSSSESEQTSAWRRSMIDQSSTIYRTSHNKKIGYSVRCLRYY
jgi:uncharacterized protein (TIGR02145 family)